jgi:hypothetical protein
LKPVVKTILAAVAGLSLSFPLALPRTALSSPPAPPEMHADLEPVAVQGDGSIIIHGQAPVNQWELVFERSDTPDFAETTAYPISVRVPFEADAGFVRVSARLIKAACRGSVGLPVERFSLPQAEGGRVVVVDWHRQVNIIDVPYDGSGYFDFPLPAWNRWYLASLVVGEEAVWHKWVGHFLPGGQDG